MLSSRVIPETFNYTRPRLKFGKRSSGQFYYRHDLPLRGVDIDILRDGSKIDSGSESGVFSTSLNATLSIVFPAATQQHFPRLVSAVLDACRQLQSRVITGRSVKIIRDSQAAIRALSSAKN